jgi:hypothetical protein
MATITEILEVGDDTAESLSRLLSRFPKGQRVKVVLTEDETVGERGTPSLEEYRAQVAAAREAAPGSPWATTEAALRELRVAEED